MSYMAASRSRRCYHYDFREDDHDYFTQPGKLFRAMTDDRKGCYLQIPRNMGDSTLQIKHRYINSCYQADPNMVRELRKH